MNDAHKIKLGSRNDARALLRPQRPPSHTRMRYRYYIVYKPRDVLSARGDKGTRPKNAPDLKRKDLYDVVRAKGFPTDVGYAWSQKCRERQKPGGRTVI